MALLRLSTIHSSLDADTLRRAALFLQSELGDVDLLAYAGDSTFAILLFGTTGESAKEIVGRFCFCLQADIFLEPRFAKLKDVKCSAGISSYEDFMTDVDELWAQADHALQQVNPKLAGKVMLYSQPEDALAPSGAVR
jgi:GGDEF domain-containing protein